MGLKEKCTKCGKSLRDKSANCLACGFMDEDLATRLYNEHLAERVARAKKQEQEFAEKFDEKAIEMITAYLNTKADHITIKQLIETLEAENLMEEFKFADSFKRRNAYQHWSTRRAIGLAKFLHRAKKAFLGTTTRQGHPYLLYLPSKVPEGVIPYNPEDVSSKADWSIKKLTKARRKVLGLSEEEKPSIPSS